MTYRDLTLEQVEAYAELRGLNIETEENYREAAQALLPLIQNLDSSDLDEFDDDPLEFLKALDRNEVNRVDNLLRNEGFSDTVRNNFIHAENIENALSMLEFDLDEIKRAIEFIQANKQ